jgi:LysM repeat protein
MLRQLAAAMVLVISGAILWLRVDWPVDAASSLWLSSAPALLAPDTVRRGPLAEPAATMVQGNQRSAAVPTLPAGPLTSSHKEAGPVLAEEARAAATPAALATDPESVPRPAAIPISGVLVEPEAIDTTASVLLTQAPAPPPATFSPPGQIIPSPSTPATSAPVSVSPRSTTHVIVSGDTLSALASRYDTSVDAIARLNSMTDPHKLSVGMRILIPR